MVGSLKEFGLWFTKKRISCGYESQRQLANKSNVNPSTICRIEAGKQKAEPETLAKLAPALGMTYEELMEKVGYIVLKEHLELFSTAKREFIIKHDIVFDLVEEKAKEGMTPNEIKEALENGIAFYIIKKK